jgi:hypothetical protein
MSEINKFAFVLSGTFVLHTYKTKYTLTHKYYHRDSDRSRTPSMGAARVVMVSRSLSTCVLSRVSSNDDERFAPSDRSSGC